MRFLAQQNHSCAEEKARCTATDLSRFLFTTQPVMHDADLGRVTISNDDGDVYVESTGEDSEIVLKTQKVRVLGDVYYNDLNVGFSARLDAVDETLTNRIDALDATQLELRGADAGLASRLDALEAAKVALQQVDVDVAALIDSLNATDATMHATDATLKSMIDALNSTDDGLKSRLDGLDTKTTTLTPPKCMPPGGDKLRFDGTNWLCVCVSAWSGPTCETPPSPPPPSPPPSPPPFESFEKLYSSWKGMNSGCPSCSSYFGHQVSISRGTIIVGAYGDSEGVAGAASSTGAAYIFVHNGTSWVQQQRLTASDGATGDSFGQVFVSGDYAVVGATGDDENGIFSGSAYVFARNGTIWTQQQKLMPSDGDERNFFGSSVAISGDNAIFGCDVDAGRAYIFSRSGTTWTEQQKLIPSDGVANARFFGKSVAISGSTALVGAMWGNGIGSMTGSAYVFVHNGTAWTEQQKLAVLDGAYNDAFGRSVAVSGDTIIVGSPGDDVSTGSAHVFIWNSTTWNQQQKLTASDGSRGDYFGTSVSISGDHAVVGAVIGKAYVFSRSNAIWTEQSKLVSSNTTSGDWFGSSVAIDNETAVVGAYLDSEARQQAGSVYVFS